LFSIITLRQLLAMVKILLTVQRSMSKKQSFAKGFRLCRRKATFYVYPWSFNLKGNVD